MRFIRVLFIILLLMIFDNGYSQGHPGVISSNSTKAIELHIEPLPMNQLSLGWGLGLINVGYTRFFNEWIGARAFCG